MLKRKKVLAANGEIQVEKNSTQKSETNIKEEC